jgi:hypothetical protein
MPDGSIKVEVKDIERITFFLHESRSDTTIDPPPGLLKPVIFEASTGDGSAQINWRYIPGAPEFDIAEKNNALDITITQINTGGFTISNYEYNIGSGWVSFNSATMPLQIDGLDNNVTYQVRIRAINSFGTGIQSLQQSASPIAIGTPSAPTITSIVAGTEKLTVNFTAPSSDGGSAILGYRYQLDGGALVDAGDVSGSFDITGLDTREYSVRILAYNVAGDGSLSNAVTGTPESATIQQTDDFNDRVIADGGSIGNLSIVNAALTQEVDNSRFDSDIVFYYTAQGRKVSGGFVNKFYDLRTADNDLSVNVNREISIEDNVWKIPGIDYVNFTSQTDVGTWCFWGWFKSSNPSKTQGLIGSRIGSGRSLRIGTSSTDTFQYRDDEANLYSNNIPDISDFVFLAGQGTSKTIKLYINGAKVRDSSTAGDAELRFRDLFFVNNSAFEGFADLICLRTSHVSDQEIEDLYNATKDFYE